MGEKRGEEQKENTEELTFTRDGSGILVQLLKVSLEGPESMPQYLWSTPWRRNIYETHYAKCREIDGDKLSITEDPSDFSSHLTDTVKNPSKPKEFVFEY